VQPIPSERLGEARAMHRAACRKDEAEFQRATIALLQTHGGAYEQDAVDYVRMCFEPLFGSPFHITRAYVTQVVRRVYDMKRHMLNGDGSLTALPSGMVFMNRLQFGFYSVLGRFDVEADYAAVEDRIFAEAGI
jgi:hypothetical protein